jgi:hypothetical protein
MLFLCAGRSPCPCGKCNVCAVSGGTSLCVDEKCPDERSCDYEIWTKRVLDEATPDSAYPAGSSDGRYVSVFHWKTDVKKRYYRKITGILLFISW